MYPFVARAFCCGFCGLVVDADWPLAQAAAALKARHKISYADAFAAALAKKHQAHLLTGDSEFESIRKDVPISWLKRS